MQLKLDLVSKREELWCSRQGDWHVQGGEMEISDGSSQDGDWSIRLDCRDEGSALNILGEEEF